MESSKSSCFPWFNSWSNVSLVYIDDNCSNLSTNGKLFADDTSLFPIVNGANESFESLGNNLCIVNNWACQ